MTQHLTRAAFSTSRRAIQTVLAMPFVLDGVRGETNRTCNYSVKAVSQAFKEKLLCRIQKWRGS